MVDRRRVALWRERLVGVWVGLTLIALGAGLGAQAVPDFDQFLSTFARMLESLRPHLLALAGLSGLGLWAAGLWRIGPAVCGVALLGGVVLAHDYETRTAPQGTRTDLTVLWLNLLYENTEPAAVLAERLLGSGADLILLGEAAPLFAETARLEAVYPYRIGCETAARCNVFVLSKWPLTVPSLRDLPSGVERFATFRVVKPGLVDLPVRAMHMVKPWYLGMSGTEEDSLAAQMSHLGGAPVLVMGDFNAAPWSRRMLAIMDRFGLGGPRFPIATWPHRAGALGVPLDHLLVGGGVRLTQAQGWGRDMGSNHSGLWARLEIPGALPSR